uniref:Uncharacterized protein n=1 Tax=Arundo donax TaxID=35708 RepID=A0A0A8YRA8_ARUDO
MACSSSSFTLLISFFRAGFLILSVSKQVLSN